MVQFYPGRHTITCANSKRSNYVSTSASPYKHLLEPQRNVLLNIIHSFCAYTDDYVVLLIKRGSIQKERRMIQTTIHNF